MAKGFVQARNFVVLYLRVTQFECHKCKKFFTVTVCSYMIRSRRERRGDHITSKVLGNVVVSESLVILEMELELLQSFLKVGEVGSFAR